MPIMIGAKNPSSGRAFQLEGFLLWHENSARCISKPSSTQRIFIYIYNVINFIYNNYIHY